jgi:hypothetical protein
LGLEAVPQLIEALGDERFTRVWQEENPYSSTPSFGGYLVPIGQFADGLLEQIRGREIDRLTGFLNDADWRLQLPARKAWLRVWFQELEEKGEKEMLLEGVRRSDFNAPLQAAILAEKYPEAALDPVAQAVRATSVKEWRTSLVESLSRISGDAPVTFLLEELRQGPYLVSRLAAARALGERKRPEVVACLLRDWVDGRIDGPDMAGGIYTWGWPQLLEFLLENGSRADLKETLPAGWEKRSFKERTEILRALASVKGTKTVPGAMEDFLLPITEDSTRVWIGRPALFGLEDGLEGKYHRMADLARRALAGFTRRQEHREEAARSGGRR